MKNSRSTISLQAKLTSFVLLTSVVLVAVSALLLHEAWDYNSRVDRIVRISQCAEPFFLAVKELTFERGRVNVALAAEAPLTQADRSFIEARRRSADDHIASALARLERLDPALAGQLDGDYKALLAAREKADQAMAGHDAAGRSQLRRDWFSQSTAFIQQVNHALDVLGKMEPEAGLFSRYHQFQQNSSEFRVLIGQSASILTAALNKNTPWTPAEYGQFIELRAQADYVWAKLEADAADLRNEDVNDKLSQVYDAYYGVYRPAQAELVPLAFTAAVPPGAVGQLQALSVPAFDAVFTLGDAAAAQTFSYTQAMRQKAAVAYKLALLQLFLVIAIVAVGAGYFRLRLFRPLHNIVEALANINNSAAALPVLAAEIKRRDEIGRLAFGVRMLQQSMAEAHRLKDRNEYLAMTDTLTGCLNRRAFYQRAEIEIDRVARENRQIAFAMIDMDNMKDINDTYGHLAGDKMLQHLVATITDSCRSYDFIGRFGGDEFMLCLQAASNQQIQEIISRIYAAIMARPLLVEGSDEHLCLKLSIGVVFGDGIENKTPEWFIGQADAALYQAKRQGGNNVVFVSAGDLGPEKA